MNVKTYEVIATPSEGWWSIEVPAVPGVASQGRSHEEVIFMATDAISLLLEIPKELINIDVRYQGELLQAHI
jgi:predicted RNase H-like HicB family nuclease